ncbi:MAG TPA: protoporphyrinogen oxidase HemJ [Roseiarcus sp.]|nr:protoporphyrinogen oxidase HemJ [Roseiarcus sp.]
MTAWTVLLEVSVMADFYLWIKALHILAIISFMAGMLYLPRLFVYHADQPPGSPQSETFKVMERRLLKAILNPAIIVVWLTGPWLAYQSGYYQSHWLQTKFALVLVLSGIHGYFARTVKVFAADKNARSARFYRILNEIPTLLLILIVILVVVKPF